MRLAGFVIHGNNQATLGRCLDSLTAVCDEVLALDSESTDGSKQIAAARVRSETRPWRGFGAAREQARRLLGPHDYVLYLDSDEWLEPEAIAAIRAWKDSAPAAEFYSVWRRDWVQLDTPFLYRREHKRRLIRQDKAAWHDRQLVHESLPRGQTVNLDVYVEHAFVTSLAQLGAKTREYAFLWAVQQARPRWSPPAWLTRATHLAREVLVKGAVFRGGAPAWQVAKAVADYHVWKYRFLSRDLTAARRLLEAGDYAGLTAVARSEALTPPAP